MNEWTPISPCWHDGFLLNSNELTSGLHGHYRALSTLRQMQDFPILHRVNYLTVIIGLCWGRARRSRSVKIGVNYLTCQKMECPVCQIVKSFVTSLPLAGISRISFIWILLFFDDPIHVWATCLFKEFANYAIVIVIFFSPVYFLKVNGSRQCRKRKNFIMSFENGPYYSYNIHSLRL